MLRIPQNLQVQYKCKESKIKPLVYSYPLVVMWYTHIEGRTHTHPQGCAISGYSVGVQQREVS